jgi:hypothetical protein
MRHIAVVSFVLMAMLAAGCGPEGQRSGFLLSGKEAAFPADWRFTDDIKEIAIQVHTPYLIPHAVTIWCAQVDGQLYVGASAPSTKHWPGWVDKNPDVRLRIGDAIYSARLVPVDDAAAIATVRAAYSTKYQLTGTPISAVPEVRYWHVTPAPAA